MNLILALKVPEQFLSDEIIEMVSEDTGIGSILFGADFNIFAVLEDITRLCYQRGVMLEKVTNIASKHLETNVALAKCHAANIYGKAVVNHREGVKNDNRN